MSEGRRVIVILNIGEKGKKGGPHYHRKIKSMFSSGWNL